MITLPIKTLKKTLDKIFSSTGYSFKDFSIKLPQPLNMTFGIVNNNNVSLKFVNNLPVISWKKFITISAYIQEIILGDEGGVIRIKYFPDLKFKYTKDDETTFFGSPLNIETIKTEISQKYDDIERREIAEKCLHYANEWVIMCYASGIDTKQFATNKSLKSSCYQFVKENVIADYKQNHGSIVISFIVIYVILPIILKWIIERIFNRLSS